MCKPLTRENIVTEQPHEPRLNVDLDEDLDPQLEDLVTVNLTNYVATLANLGKDETDRKILRQGLIVACKAYVRGHWDEQNQRTEKQDNEALDRVTRSSQALYDALLSLQEHPGLEPRLEQSIRLNQNLYSVNGDFDLSQMINVRRNIFSKFREVLVDLQICTEHVINRQPKPTILEPIDGFEGEDEDEQGSIQLETSEKMDVLKQQWRARSKARKLPKDFALQEFLHAFRPTWVALTDHPFTEGMHYVEAGETVSTLVDGLEPILRELAPEIRRQDVVTALRKMRDSAAAKLPS